MTEAFLNQLAKLLGAEHVVSNARMLEALATGHAQPGALCKPGSTEEVAAVVRLAGEHGVPVLPCGGWTAMALGGEAPEGALALSLQRLDKMIAYEPADLVATAQAGMSFDVFQEALFEHGQTLPLDAPAHATLGGLVATDRSGPRRLMHGTLRDMVLGLTVVNGDGVVRKCGGRVVKNVTGYALEKLYIGSLGTLGIVTEATFKLRPRPETASVQEISAPDFGHGFELMRDLAGRLPLAAAVACFPAKPFSAQLGIEASPPDHARLLKELEEAAAKAGAEVRETGAERVDADEYPAVSRRLESIALPGGETVAPALAARLSWPAKPADFKTQMDRLDRLAAEAGFGYLMGYLDFPGFVSLELFANGGTEAPNLDALVRALRTDGVPATVSWKSGAQPLSEPVFGPPRAEWALMREIKKALDPRGILNPGRFIAGL
ncbi:MAG: FAD-binding oxidoreductase [Candidatus Rokubacteria bacterium]|nr:FAD-binding oxidoreductase [Candidatus Rokubacteria bacterium]